MVIVFGVFLCLTGAKMLVTAKSSEGSRFLRARKWEAVRNPAVGDARIHRDHGYRIRQLPRRTAFSKFVSSVYTDSQKNLLVAQRNSK